MANLPESATFDAGVYQIETNDPVLGGVDGIANLAAKNLTNRTAWLKENVDSLLVTRGGGFADITTFTGNPAAGNLVAGRFHLVTGLNVENAGLVLTLPAVSAGNRGAAITVKAVSANTTSGLIGPVTDLRGALVIQRAGGNVIQPEESTTGTVTSVSIINGETITFVSDGSNRWMITQWERQDLVLPGVINYYAGMSAPEGWLKCNGIAISRTVYARLFAAIGTTFGSGNGSTTFNLPDLRGEFIRGWDDGRGVDPSRNFGSLQRGSLIPVDPDGATNAYVAQYNSTGLGSNDAALVASRVGLDLDTNGATNYPNTITSWLATTNGTNFNYGVTRPRNVALLPIIKF